MIGARSATCTSPRIRLEPVRPESPAVPEDDPLGRIQDFAVDGPGGALSNEEIDGLVYGS